MRLGQLPGVRQIPPLLHRVDDRTVLFESWHGDYSGNPRAISEALQRRDGSFRQLWATEQGGHPPNSRAYLEALGRAGHVVSNLNMPGYFRKKRGTIYLQTWHGTPLKRIGFDIEQFDFAGKKLYLTNLARDVAKWDLLVSANRFSSEVFREAFRYEGEILETGYPRNDVLCRSAGNELGAGVRGHLGVPAGTRTILYAPTWRERGGFTLALDFDRLIPELGDEWRVLFRAHKMDAGQAASAIHPAVIDVTEYPDISDLYLAADVLLTDYSSAMFDFAVTGKPMIFFTYDLAEYRDQVRGFYFDFEREAPGPLLQTTPEVWEALRELDNITRHYATAYSRFRKRFCYLEDGRASERVIDAVFTA